MRFRNKYSPQVIKNKLLIVPKIYDVPPIPITGNSDLETHVLVSKRDFPAMLWALYSFYYFASSDISLVVHDDGSLNKNHQKKLEAIFPGSTLIYRSESDVKMDQELALFPKCKELRKGHPTNLKIIDFFTFASKNNILFFDSDIIFFCNPDRIINQETPENLFLEDMGTGYVLSPEEIASDFQIKVPPKINIGFGKIHRDCFDRDFIEFCLAREKLSRGPYITDQTIVAMLAARGPNGVQTVGGAYKMEIRPATEGKVVNHYVNIIRYLFYTEGIPWVYQNLLNKK
jgi:hypothetical protein